MSRGIIVRICTRCERRYFPHRLLCPCCGGTRFRSERVDRATVQDATVVHRAVGVEGRETTVVATVTLDGGGEPVIAGLARELPPGTTVVLEQDGRAVRARPLSL